MSLYTPRPVHFFGVVDGKEHKAPASKIKLYGVTAREGQTPGQKLIKAAKLFAFERLPKPIEPSIPESPLSISIACVHETMDPVFLLTGLWANVNELHVGVAMLIDSRDVIFVSLDSSRMPLCTWDLAILAFERDAWVNNVLKNPCPATIAAYLSMGLDARL